MKLFFRFTITIYFLTLTVDSRAQQTLPIYSDYLSDNVFLIHPSAAGIGNTGKLRFTARQQWQGIKDAPTLQTISFHNRFGRSAAFGFVLFNDRNGYHSQKGLQGTYAYHIDVDRGSHQSTIIWAFVNSSSESVGQTQFQGDPQVLRLIQVIVILMPILV